MTQISDWLELKSLVVLSLFLISSAAFITALSVLLVILFRNGLYRHRGAVATPTAVPAAPPIEKRKLQPKEKEGKVAMTAAKILFVALIIAFGAAVLGVSTGLGGPLLFLFSLAMLVGLFIYQGFQQIPNVPLTVGLYTLFGRLQPKVAREGWQFFPLYPFFYGFIPIKVERVNQDLPAKLFKTPEGDMTTLNVEQALTWAPDWGNPENLIEYARNGYEQGVRNILDDVIPERTREWLASKREGPQKWQDAVSAQEEAAWVLLKAIMGDALPEIPSVIPSPILLRLIFWDGDLSDKEREKWQPVLDGYTDEESNAIVEAMKERRRLVKSLREGNGRLSVPHLGIKLNRLNLSSVMPTGVVEEASQKIAKERLEGEAEKIEAENLVARTREIAAALEVEHPEAVEYFQAERGKITKQVKVGKLALSPEAERLLRDGAAALGNGLKGVAELVVRAFGKGSSS